uniref:CG-1 domain-containing protein n=1 Tax=Macrostomum lignano TaxID=282301 RepID=A0A1I8H148_9PLAT
ESKVCNHLPHRPHGNSVFVVRRDGKTEDDWRNDGYRWIYDGTHFSPRKGSKEQAKYKIYRFSSMSADRSRIGGFRKVAYQSFEVTRYIVVQYIGDSSLAESFPHGNCNQGNKSEYKRTDPSVLQNFKENFSDLPSKVYKDSIGSHVPKDMEGVTNARNLSQVRNAMHNERKRQLIHNDQVLAVCLLNEEISCVKLLQLIPEPCL